MRIITQNELLQCTGGNTNKPLKMTKENAFFSGFIFGIFTSMVAFRNGVIVGIISGTVTGVFYAAHSNES